MILTEELDLRILSLKNEGLATELSYCFIQAVSEDLKDLEDLKDIKDF